MTVDEELNNCLRAMQEVYAYQGNPEGQVIILTTAVKHLMNAVAAQDKLIKAKSPEPRKDSAFSIMATDLAVTFLRSCGALVDVSNAGTMVITW
jgi:hypothetical protein